jgi:serine/threonine-protein kinase RsbW
MASSESLRVPASGEGVRRVADGLDAFSGEHRLPLETIQAAQVALDEILSNTVRSGYEPGTPPGEIEVRFGIRDGLLEILISDDARPFNPLEREDPDVSAPLEEKPIGGLGIYLVKRLMDVVEYERAGGRNRLRLGKRIGA